MSIQIMQKSVLKYLPVLTYTKIDVREAFTVTIKAFTLAMCRLPLLLLVNIEVRKFDQYHRYLSLVSLRLQKVYPNTWILWFKRQMDLELIFYSIISLRTASWGKWTKFLKKIFGFSFSVFSTHTHRKPIHISSALITEHIHISSAKNFFRFQRTFRPYSITSSHVQNKAYIVTILHHRTLLIKLTLIKSLDHNYNTCSKLTLHHPTIPLHPPIFIHLQIRLGFQLPHVSPAFLSPVRKYVLSSISNYIWNTSKLLLFPGKVETNTIPQTIDQDPVFCSICSDRIYRGIRQDTVPICSNKNCNAWCHQACSGLSTSQSRHTKNFGRTITWKCPEHSTGIAKIIIPPPPVYELPSRPSTAGKSCSVCKNPIRRQYADRAYHCANPSWDNVCHLAVTYSGFANPRRTAKARIFSNRTWLCHLHSSTPATGHQPTQSDTSPPRPTALSLNSLLNQGLSMADAKEKCAKCFAALRSNTVPVRCSVHAKGFHQKCSTGPKASTRDNQWKCETCINLQQNHRAE